MGDENSATSLRKKCSLLLLRGVVMGLLMLARVTYGDESGVPTAGLLCISDCATCPVICSPPPPPQESHSTRSPPPPAIHHSPPQSYYNSPPPPASPHQSPMSPAPPAPESSYPSWGIPPPPFGFYNPPSGMAPPMVGPRDYPYPYYYFYASKASTSLPFYASTFLVMLVLHVLYFSS